MGIQGVSGISQGTGYQVNATSNSDTKVKQFDQTLTRLKQNLQRTEEDAALTQKEKLEQSQEIQKQIDSINRQKKLAELEAEKEQDKRSQSGTQQQSDGVVSQTDEGESIALTEDSTQNIREDEEAQAQDVVGVEEEEDPTDRLLTSDEMEAVIIGDNAVKQAKGQQTTVTELENRIRVLGGEIRVDEGRGGDTTAKTSAQQELEDRVKQAREQTGSRLGTAKKKAEERQQTQEVKKQADRSYRFIAQNGTDLPGFQLQI